MLENIWLVYHITIFYNILLTAATKIYCDNKGLISRIKQARNNENRSPRRFLNAEIDIEMQIMDTMQQLQMTECEMIHVTWHQDDDKQFENLTWESKMNVYCDQLATDEINKITLPSWYIPMLPASRITLKIEGHIITHHIPRQIWQIWGKQQQKKYLSKHHRWSLNQFKEIDWYLFRHTFYKFSFQKNSSLLNGLIRSFHWTNAITSSTWQIQPNAHHSAKAKKLKLTFSDAHTLQDKKYTTHLSNNSQE